MECPRQLATAEILTGDDPNDILPDLTSRDTGPPRLCREYYNADTEIKQKMHYPSSLKILNILKEAYFHNL